MYINLSKILKALAKELTIEVTRQVTEKLRESYVADVTAIVKDCFKNNEIYNSSGAGFLTIEAISLKYKISTKTIGNYVKQFGVERKKAGRRKLIHEIQLLEAMQKPMEKPKFLQKDQKTPVFNLKNKCI